MSATVRELVGEAYERRESTWRAALETVEDWIDAARSRSPQLTEDRMRIVPGRIKDPLRTGEKLRRKLADANDEIHEAVEVENQVIDVVGARAVCRTEREQSVLWDILTDPNDDSAISIVEVRDYTAHPKPSGYRGRHLIVEVPFDSEPPCSSNSRSARSSRTPGASSPRSTCSNPARCSPPIRSRRGSPSSSPASSRRPTPWPGSSPTTSAPTWPRQCGSPADDVRSRRGGSVDRGDDPRAQPLLRPRRRRGGPPRIIRFETLGLTPDNPDRAGLPSPGDTLRVRMDESHSTRYFIPVSGEG